MNGRWVGTTPARAIPVPNHAVEIAFSGVELGPEGSGDNSVPNLTTQIDILGGVLGTTGTFSFFVPSISSQIAKNRVQNCYFFPLYLIPLHTLGLRQYFRYNSSGGNSHA